MAEINTELVREWVTALRSGDYTQGTDLLRNEDDNSFCCLGVLCDISGVGEWHKGENDDWRYKTEGEESDVELPDAVSEKVGIVHEVPVTNSKRADLDSSFHLGSDTYSAAVLNDSGEYSFEEIADLIEERYLNG